MGQLCFQALGSGPNPLPAFGELLLGTVGLEASSCFMLSSQHGWLVGRDPKFHLIQSGQGDRYTR